MKVIVKDLVIEYVIFSSAVHLASHLSNLFNKYVLATELSSIVDKLIPFSGTSPIST